MSSLHTEGVFSRRKFGIRDVLVAGSPYPIPVKRFHTIIVLVGLGSRGTEQGHVKTDIGLIIRQDDFIRMYDTLFQG